MTDIRVPNMGESVTEATVAKWLKKVGDAVAADEPLVELETDKVAVEVNAPSAGVLAEITTAPGASVKVGGLLGTISGSGAAVKAPAAAPAAKPAPAPVAAAPAAAPAASTTGDRPLAPSVRRIVEETGIAPAAINPTGPGGRITKGDALAALEARAASPATPAVAAAPAAAVHGPRAADPREQRVPMTRLRKTIALRLKEAQNTAAQLTTFNEADMSAVMALRSEFKDAFEKRHGVRLGFMSFFVKACIAALRELPAVNAEINGDDIVYKNHYDIGVAVATERGLVVPVVREADKMSLAGLEKAINDYGLRARDGKLKLEELQGGTFTISNGGVYGSLMSTPILNAPQSGILGMHKIQERPMAVGGKVEIRPMMYLALSYDHRLVDGREAVLFLVRVKDFLENPSRMLLEV